MAYDDWSNKASLRPIPGTTKPSRLDRKRGRFSVDFETNEITQGLRAQQDVSGDYVAYYAFDPAGSTVNDVYDEGTGGGRSYHGPIDLPVYHVTHLEGGQNVNENGLYYRDSLHITVLFDTFQKVGLTDTDIEHQHYIRDRVVYDDKVFRVTKMEVLGQIQQRDVVISVDAEQVRSDELVDDVQFARWSA